MIERAADPRSDRRPRRRRWWAVTCAVLAVTVLTGAAHTAGSARSDTSPAAGARGALAPATSRIGTVTRTSTTTRRAGAAASGRATSTARTTARATTTARTTAPTAVRVAAVTAPAPGFVIRSGNQLLLGGRSFRFAGTNEYYLGLDDNLRDAAGNPTLPTHAMTDAALGAAVRSGATVVRSHSLGISVGCSVCLEPTRGSFNDAALASADYAVYRAGQLGLKLMIPLTDQWRYYHGGESVFAGWAGYPVDPDLSRNAANSNAERAAEAHFYTDPAVVADFEAYLAHLLGHVNPYTGLAWKNDPTVLAWETGNELWTAPPAWTQTVAGYLKHVVGVRQLVADGSAASGNTVANAALTAPDVDIVGGHFYPVNVPAMVADAALAAANRKAYVVGEFDWTNPSATTALIAAVQSNANIAGDLFWTMMPRAADGTPEPHDDGYAMYDPPTSTGAAAVLALLTAHANWMTAAR